MPKGYWIVRVDVTDEDKSRRPTASENYRRKQKKWPLSRPNM